MGDADDRSVLECSLVLPILELASTLMSASPSPSYALPSASSSQKDQPKQQQQQRSPPLLPTRARKSRSKGFGTPAAPAAVSSKSVQPTTFQRMPLFAVNDKRLELIELVSFSVVGILIFIESSPFVNNRLQQLVDRKSTCTYIQSTHAPETQSLYSRHTFALVKHMQKASWFLRLYSLDTFAQALRVDSDSSDPCFLLNTQ